MAEFEVTVSRSAYETARLKVKASSQEAAEMKISGRLDALERCGLDDLAKMDGVRIVELELEGDEESSWEVI